MSKLYSIILEDSLRFQCSRYLELTVNAPYIDPYIGNLRHAMKVLAKLNRQKNLYKSLLFKDKLSKTVHFRESNS